ncbi:MAG: hypothetical protein IT435_10470 [Phycisphaerales bacterium]|nr:hypothetical protein [Phycisphaerales bacterium]
MKIADNLIKRRHRRLRRFEAIIAGEDTRNDLRPARTSDHGEESDFSDRTSTRSAWDALTEGEQDAVRLVVCEGLSYESAARSLDVRVSTLNNWKFRGIQRLKEHADHQAHRHAGSDRRTLAARGVQRKGSL